MGQPQLMITKFDGTIEIQHDRGVIYFTSHGRGCIFKISRLPTPIPRVDTTPLNSQLVESRQLEIVHMTGTDWGPITEVERNDCGRSGLSLEKEILAKLEREQQSETPPPGAPGTKHYPHEGLHHRPEPWYGTYPGE